jgi:hypothetical protein
VTSVSLPVATSKTNPRTASVCGMNGLAVGVVDEDDLGGVEQPLADRERADLVLGDHATGVADDVCVAFVQVQDGVKR